MTMSSGRRSRTGFTLVEALVALGIVVVLILIAIPVIYKGGQRFKRRGCEANLRHIGEALNTFQNKFGGKYPTGCKYQKNPESPWGGSWWFDLLPYTDYASVKQGWTNVTSSGNFNTPNVPNPNITKVDGLRMDMMFCPSSDLPQGSDPVKSISAENQKLLGHPAAGIPVPHYAAISGGTPDLLGGGSGSGPRGRNTKDGKYGILSSSGMFPPNVGISIAAVRDGQGQVMAVAEQSRLWQDESYDPPVGFDFRSSWPNGAFMGAGADFGQLGVGAEGINGTGDARCFNCTTVRYRVNELGLQLGMFTENLQPYPPPKEGEPPRKPPMKHPAGPGHNQGIFSAHSGGANVLYVDGSVHFMSDETDLGVLQKLATRDDLQPVDQ